MNRLISGVVTALVAGLLVLTPSATAATSWDDWSKAKADTRARLPVAYGAPGTAVAQVKRGTADRRKHQVTSRWRPLDNAAQPAGKWRTKKWTKINRNERKRLRIPALQCYPDFREVQVVVRVKKKSWSKPKVLVSERGATTNDC